MESKQKQMSINEIYAWFEKKLGNKKMNDTWKVMY